MISMSHICKNYKISKRDAGLKSAIKSLFNKEYEIINALDDISFNISEGEIVGYIGPNGAGKSSTIKIMSGILTPDSGECVINGKVPWRDRKEYVHDIGVVFGQRSQLWWDVSVEESFLLLKDIYEIDSNKYIKTKDEICELLKIGDLLKIPARQLSLGQRMRCELAASLLHEPKILFLDEPTIGLDAVSKIAVRSFISDINKEKKTTVILTTHDMQDIESLTNRVLFIGKGKLLLDGSMEEWKDKFSVEKKLEISYIHSDKITYSEIVKGLKGVRISNLYKGKMELIIDLSITTISKIICKLSSLIEITNISIFTPTADEIIVSMYEEYRV